MKSFALALRYAINSLVALFSLAFTVLEATLLLTLDFTLYENRLLALIQIILRLLIASSALTLGIAALIKRTRCFLPHSICLLASSVVMIFFASNNVGIYFTVLSALFMLLQLLFSKMQVQN